MNNISLSIVSHGHGALLTALLADLAALPDAKDANVIVTLNLEGEPFDETQFHPLQIDVVRNRQPKGFGANHNAAFRRSHRDWFVVLNPDLRLREDPFATLVACAEHYPETAVFSPVVLDPNGCPEDHVRHNLTPWSLIRRCLHIEPSIDITRPSCRSDIFYWLGGMFLMFRSQAFRNVGGFDERLFLYCEDFDVCARLYLSGYALRLVKDSRVIHYARRNSHNSWNHLRWHLTSLSKVWTSLPFWQLVLRQTRDLPVLDGSPDNCQKENRR